jgi:hypothetical protein
MTRDFTYRKYEELLESYIKCGYELTSYEEFLKTKPQKAVILRHDVDKKPGNSLETARIENKLNVRGSYYFRIIPESFNKYYIKQIAELGHEIGYHYEDLTLSKGDYVKAIQLFEKNIQLFRELYPVKTMCMHGSPLSKWDNKLLWKKYNYKDFGIIAEPYFDIDYNRFLYITDTGRSWRNTSSNVRDKVNSGFDFQFQSTDDIIDHLKENKLPSLIIQNIHPQRWNNNLANWSKEFIIQNIKNMIKRMVIKMRK